MSIVPRRTPSDAELIALMAELLGGFDPDHYALAVIAVADSAPGVNTTLLSLDLYRMGGTDRSTSPRQVMIRFSSTLYSGTVDSSPTLGTVTAGTLIASLSGLFLVETDANGNFDCTVTNATDETLYAVATTSIAGVTDLAKACVVAGCVPNAVTWGP